MIVTVTLNPAMDKVLVLDKFRLNVTNRIQSQFTCIGGKGTHISINLSLLGIRSTAIGVVMGKNGEDILQVLKSMNVDVQFLQLSEGNSRINYVLVDNESNCTLISEKGQIMDDSVLERLVYHYSSLIQKDDIIVISGDASNQKGTGLQDRLIDLAIEKHAKVCLDASGEHLAAGIRKGPFLIKPNMDELSTLCGRKLESHREILDAIHELTVYGIENIIVSCGSKGSFVYSNGQYYHVIAPKVAVKNTVGCGDALVAGILAGFEQGFTMEANLKQASAIAAATAMNVATVGFDTGLIKQLSEEVVVKPLQLNR